jgi:WD40 repeat protein
MSTKIEQHIPSMHPTYILTLPEELYENIFSRLELKDFQQLPLVSTIFKRIANDDRLRKIVFLRDFPTRKPIDVVFRNALRLKDRSEVPVSEKSDLISWKDQYQYAFQTRAHVRKGISDVQTIKGIGHKNRISCLGSKYPYFFSGSFDGRIIVHHLSDPTLRQTLNCQGGVFCLKDDYLVSKSHQDLQVKVFGKAGCEEWQTVHCDGSKILEFCLQNDLLFARGENGVLKVWKKDVEGKFHEAFSLSDVYQFHAKGDYLFAALQDGTLSILKKDGEGAFFPLQIIKDPSSTPPFLIQGLGFENGHLVTVGFDGGLKNWKINEAGLFVELQSLIGTSEMDSVTHFVIKDDYAIIGFLRGGLKVFKKDENGLFNDIQTLSEHSDRINSIELEGDYLLSGSTDASAKIWEKNKEGKFDLVQTLQGEKAVSCVHIKDFRFVLGYWDGTIQVRDFNHGISL